MNQITIAGNLTADPELRSTSSGKAVANFTVAAESKRVKDGDGWKDGPASFWRCALWGPAAENMTNSLRKGDRVVVTGEAQQRTWETSAGEKRSSMELRVDDVGASVKWATVSIVKGGRSAPRDSTPPADDPWNAAPGTDEPPF